jgi:hypothetical protein
MFGGSEQGKYGEGKSVSPRFPYAKLGELGCISLYFNTLVCWYLPVFFYFAGVDSPSVIQGVILVEDPQPDNTAGTFLQAA